MRINLHHLHQCTIITDRVWSILVRFPTPLVNTVSWGTWLGQCVQGAGNHQQWLVFLSHPPSHPSKPAQHPGAGWKGAGAWGGICERLFRSDNEDSDHLGSVKYCEKGEWFGSLQKRRSCPKDFGPLSGSNIDVSIYCVLYVMVRWYMLWYDSAHCVLYLIFLSVGLRLPSGR